jgi:hypothetical protein
MSQSTDDPTRSELRAIRGHYSRTTKSRRAPLVCLATGTSQSRSARVTGGSGARRGLGGKERCDASVVCNATALGSPTR